MATKFAYKGRSEESEIGDPASTKKCAVMCFTLNLLYVSEKYLNIFGIVTKYLVSPGRHICKSFNNKKIVLTGGASGFKRSLHLSFSPPTPPPRFYPSDSAPSTSTPPTRPALILPLRLHPLAFTPPTPPHPHLPLRLHPLAFTPQTPPPTHLPIWLGPL